MRRLATAVLITGGIFAASVSTAGAATITPSPCPDQYGACTVESIHNLVVDGVAYDIDFKFGTYADLFGETVYSNAASFETAINSVLNENDAVRVREPGEVSSLYYTLPVALYLEDRVVFTVSRWQFNGVDWDHWASGNDIFYDTEVYWAVPNPVPVPAALPLLMSALGFFGFLGWRRKRMVAAWRQ